MEKKTPSAPERKIVAENRKARFQYEILEKIEAGLVLVGSEVKSLRGGRASLEEAYAMIDPHKNEAFLIQAHIPEYPAATIFNHEPTRKRKLLLKKSEIQRMRSKLRERGLTLIALSLYFHHGIAKLTLGIAKGKKLHDKRDTIKKRQAKRDIDRGMSRRR